MVPVHSAEELGHLLRERRRGQGLTLKQVSDHTGFSVRFISEVERGKPTAELQKVIDLAGMLGIDLMAVPR